MMARPTSVTVICLSMVILAGLMLVHTAMAPPETVIQTERERTLIPIPLQFAYLYLGFIVTFTCGIALLKRRNWGRILYVLWNIAGLTLSFAPSQMGTQMLLGQAIFIIVVVFLFGPKANAYVFQRNHSAGLSRK
jgi:hypothetical protein